MSSNTVRRDKLWRLCVAGRLEMAGSYHFDDMKDGVAVPIRPDPGDWRLRLPGICYLRKSDFESHGRAWSNADGTVTLYVHSNCFYTLRIKPAAVSA